MRSKQYDILFFSNNIYNTCKRDGKYYNWHCDDYAELFREQTFVFEKSQKFNVSRPRLLKNIANYDILFIKNRIHSKIVRIHPKDVQTIIQLLNFLENSYISDISETKLLEIKSRLHFFAKRIDYEIKQYKKIFEKIKPKIIFFDSPSYDGNNHIINLAKHMGITTCELQHGFVNKNHMAYNYSEKIILNGEFLNIFPEFFLTFGEYWANEIRTVSKIITLGSPKIQGYRKEDKEHLQSKKKIVFMIDQINKENIFSLIDFLSGEGFLECKYELILRPHPGDLEFFEEYRCFALKYNILFESEISINECLSKADAIVSEGSTVIYEALAYGVVPFVRKTLLALFMEFNENDVVYYETDQEFVSKLNNIDLFSQSKIDADKYFDPNWKQNYQNFIDDILK